MPHVCDQNPELISHLLLGCVYNREVWANFGEVGSDGRLQLHGLVAFVAQAGYQVKKEGVRLNHFPRQQMHMAAME
jgi:hypothetical protein